MGVTIEDVLDKIKQYAPNAPFDTVTEAYDFASRAHAGQRRDSGDWDITTRLRYLSLQNLKWMSQQLLLGYFMTSLKIQT